MRRAAKVDANQREVVEGLRAVGVTVLPLHAVGQGCPDILAGYRGRNYLLEIKDGSKPPSARKLTPAQEEFFATWRGHVSKVESLEQAFEVVIGYDPRQ